MIRTVVFCEVNRVRVELVSTLIHYKGGGKLPTGSKARRSRRKAFIDRPYASVSFGPPPLKLVG
ncbi:MAG: hypothetical protein A2W07_02120 [candidate division Zixibacteria bacterium RBG_16_43_9]|nr:MAG: hypothetical protein A2W07_02120 [candidate division Zixibacteria bacterium RBG_16_43_9]